MTYYSWTIHRLKPLVLIPVSPHKFIHEPNNILSRYLISDWTACPYIRWIEGMTAPLPGRHHSFFTLGRHRRWRVLSSVNASSRPSVCPSVHPEWRYRSNSSRISAISLKFHGMMHSSMEQIAISNWSCLANFCVFHGTLKFSMIVFYLVWGTTLPL